MKIKMLCFAVFLLSLVSSAGGQDEKRAFLYLDAGIDLIGCNAPEKDYIRGDIDPNPYDDVTFGPDNVTDQITSLLYADYLGVKFEYRVLKNKVGIAGGLRYSWLISSIGRSSYWSDTPEYFYLQYAQDGTNTEYAKVREVVQKAGYVGIPLELSVYPFNPRVVNLYFKAGASFNFNVTNKTDIVFYNEEMEPYEDEVAEVIEEPWPFYSSLYLGIGLLVPKSAKPGFNIEFCIPVGMITTGDPALVDSKAGVGFHLMFRIPL